MRKTLTIAALLFAAATLFGATAQAETALELGQKYFEWCRAGEVQKLYEAGDFYYRETKCQNDPATCPTPIVDGTQDNLLSEDVGCTEAKCTYRATTSGSGDEPAYEWTVEFYRPEGEFKSCIAATPATRPSSNSGLLFFPIMALVWTMLTFMLWRLILVLLAHGRGGDTKEKTRPEN